jgi:hypothetical protein
LNQGKNERPKETQVDPDEVDDRFLAQVMADYTNEQYMALVRAFHRPWEDHLLRLGGRDAKFLELWRRAFTYNEEIIFDGVATAAESQQRQ